MKLTRAMLSSAMTVDCSTGLKQRPSAAPVQQEVSSAPLSINCDLFSTYLCLNHYVYVLD